MAVERAVRKQDDRAVYVVALRSAEAMDVERVGAKAGNLAQVAQAGFPVPDGFVLTTAAFARFLEENGLGPQSDRETVLAAPVPADVQEAVVGAVRAWGDRPLAVRSSGVAEDLPGASFAGQYESTLESGASRR